MVIYLFSVGDNSSCAWNHSVEYITVTHIYSSFMAFCFYVYLATVGFLSSMWAHVPNESVLLTEACVTLFTWIWSFSWNREVNKKTMFPGIHTIYEHVTSLSHRSHALMELEQTNFQAHSYHFLMSASTTWAFSFIDFWVCMHELSDSCTEYSYIGSNMTLIHG